MNKIDCDKKGEKMMNEGREEGNMKKLKMSF